MAAPRIGDRELAGAARAEPETTGVGVRFGTALASPVGILLVVPGLVAVVGLSLTLLGQGALHESTAELGRDRFAEQTAFTARSIAESLAQSDAMLDRMRELAATWSPEAPPALIAQALRGVMKGRAGVAYASVSHPDGTFQGAYLDTDGVTRFKEARVTTNGVVMSVFDFTETGGLVLRSREPSTYDPRTRDFYRRAVDSGRRVWTEPYLFFSSLQTGVTRTEPVFDPLPGPAAGRRLRAVLTADFDVHALSSSLAHAPLRGAKTLLYTRQGVVLAYPEGAKVIAGLPHRSDRPLSHADLGDPVIDAFFSLGRAAPPGDFIEFTAGGEAALAMTMAVPRFPELGWSVAAIVPRDLFFRARVVHERQSLLAAALSLLLALAVAVVFSRHVVRVREAASSARALAQQAADRAKELGSHRLIERIGQGGMGEVWRAEHRLLARQAAIKLIRPEALARAGRTPSELRERFRREAQTLATLRSRHTIQIFDYGVAEDGTFFYVMELLDGMDLHSLVERDGPQPAGRVIHLLLQACSSLAEAHAAGLVHRDVKPANLFVCRAADELDVVKVLDFGLVQAGAAPGRVTTRARAVTLSRGAADPRITGAGQQMGTPAFMAPEQARGDEIDRRADLYALGCVAAWLLTGRLPFEAGTALSTMMAHIYSPPPDLSACVGGFYPPELDELLRRCLDKRPDARPSDALALAEALRAVPLPPAEVWTAARARAWWERLASAPAAQTG